MGDSIPIDPALMADDDGNTTGTGTAAYHSSLSGIFPSSHSDLRGASASASDLVDSGRGASSVERDGTPGSSSTKKRKKSMGGGDDDDKPKKSRQSQSCDACRSRKVKCDRPPPSSTNSDLPPKDVCTHCAHLNLACTFDYVPKKRGPPNLYLRKLREEGHDVSIPPRSPAPKAAGAKHDDSSSPQDPRRPSMSNYSEYSQQHPLAQPNPPHNPYLSTGNYFDGSPQSTIPSESAMRQGQSSLSSYPMSGGGNDSWTTPDMLMTLASASQPGRPPMSSSTGSHTEHNPYPSPQITTQRPSSSSVPSQSLPQQPFGAPSTSPLVSKSSPGYPQYAQYPHNPNNPFDRILPRGLLYHVVDLYFDYIYALIPCLHKPSFMASLHDGREERPDEDEWIALVMAVVAGTLVQVPHAFLAIPKEEKKSLVERCYAVVKGFLAKDFTEVTVSRCIIYYLSGFTARVLGFPSVAAMHFACNIALVVRMRLNEEATYQNLSPVYRELCRRIFWLAYGGDKSIASMDGEVVLIHEDECADVALPAEVDDEFVGDSRYGEQPVGRTSVISGFVYISKLFRLIGQFLNKKRGDRRKPLSGVMLQMRLNEIADLYERVQTLMNDCPEALRLDTDSDNKSVGSLEDDWDIHASADVRNLFCDPKAPKAVVRDAYLVQQSNIYVTQQMARQMILQYRDELLALQANELALQTSASDNGGGRRMAEWTKALIPDDKDQIASDLLMILQKIPVQVIAVNSTSMMGKIRFVASSLLDTLAVQSGDGNGNGIELPLRLQKAQNYLWDFLRILSEIEALYLLCDDQKGQLIR